MKLDIRDNGLISIWAVSGMRCRQDGFTGKCAVAFGLGLVISCFCPTGLMLFIVAVIIVVLGIALLRC